MRQKILYGVIWPSTLDIPILDSGRFVNSGFVGGLLFWGYLTRVCADKSSSRLQNLFLAILGGVRPDTEGLNCTTLSTQLE